MQQSSVITTIPTEISIERPSPHLVAPGGRRGALLRPIAVLGGTGVSEEAVNERHVRHRERHSGALHEKADRLISGGGPLHHQLQEGAVLRGGRLQQAGGVQIQSADSSQLTSRGQLMQEFSSRCYECVGIHAKNLAEMYQVKAIKA